MIPWCFTILRLKRFDVNYFTSLPFSFSCHDLLVENFVAKPCSFRSLKKGLQNIRFVRRFSIMLIFHFILPARECKKNTANIQRNIFVQIRNGSILFTCMWTLLSILRCKFKSQEI